MSNKDIPVRALQLGERIESTRELVRTRYAEAAGYRLEPAIQIPSDAVEIGISRDGIVSVTVVGDTGNIQEIG